MPYHVSLDLSPDQVKKLKVRAIAKGITVKELVTTSMQNCLSDWDKESVAGGGSREKTSAKSKF